MKSKQLCCTPDHTTQITLPRFPEARITLAKAPVLGMFPQFEILHELSPAFFLSCRPTSRASSVGAMGGNSSCGSIGGRDHGGVCSVCHIQGKKGPHDKMISCRECSNKGIINMLNRSITSKIFFLSIFKVYQNFQYLFLNKH